MLLDSIITGRLSQHVLLLVQSSSAQSALDIVKMVVGDSRRSRVRTLLFCLLYPPPTLLHSDEGTVDVYDRTGNIPGYCKSWTDPCKEILANVKAVTGAVNVIIDSVDTLASDLGSVTAAYFFIAELLSLVRSKPNPSRLVIHINSHSPILPLLTQTTLSSSLTCIRAHPPEVLMHLATTLLTPPPPISPASKFWSVFIPFSERHYEIDRLIFGHEGRSCVGASKGEAVIEILIRGNADGGRRRGIDRVLEGFSVKLGPCELNELDTLKGVWAPVSAQAAPDPTQNLSFNLNLTPSQQQSRASLPLPYAHEGEPMQSSSLIHYEPDFADDIDDDDPDEDLDI